jgi:hypothetical protein
MAHKKRHTAPIPPANQSKIGPAGAGGAGQNVGPADGAPFQDQDPKRRLGGFESAGEHSRQQPSRINDGTQHSK